MPYSLHNDTQLSTITAVAQVHRFVFAGEGPLLKIYEKDDPVPVFVERCFASYSIHGILVLEWSDDAPLVLLWGGHHVRILLLNISSGHGNDGHVIKCSSSASLSCADWILHASFSPMKQSDGQNVKVALITAHNALSELTVSLPSAVPEDATTDMSSELQLSRSDLSAATRCTLYTAHVHWISETHLLVASGTAFGEIIIWSCVVELASSSRDVSKHEIHVHHAFTAHEGSIFGLDVLHIPAKVPITTSKLLVASCSDDRTIRIWDASRALREGRVDGVKTPNHLEGVSNEGTDISYPVPTRYAQGWAHTSRIWHIAFLSRADALSISDYPIQLVSIGEDATYQHWDLQEMSDMSCDTTSAILVHIGTFSNHAGKNIWSYGLFQSDRGQTTLTTGGADGTIALSELQPNSRNFKEKSLARCEWPIESLASVLGSIDIPVLENDSPMKDTRSLDSSVVGTPGKNVKLKRKSVIKAPKNSFKAYDFINSRSLLVSTQQGHLLLGTLDEQSPAIGSQSAQESPEDISWKLIETYSTLVGYSIIKGLFGVGLAFFTGTDGVIYCYHRASQKTSEVCHVDGRVASLFVHQLDPLHVNGNSASGSQDILLLVTRLGKPTAQVFHYVLDNQGMVEMQQCQFEINMHNDFIATTALFMGRSNQELTVFLGSRDGELARFRLDDSQTVLESRQRWICHSDTVTSLRWISELATDTKSILPGHLVTTGRDHTYAVTRLTAGAAQEQILRLALPFGPYIEGIDVRVYDQHVILHGFHSKFFIVWDETAQRELMRVDCGGAHRAWTFQLSQDFDDPTVGVLVWTQASKLCKYSALKRVQTIIRRGGHGREIKACAVNPKFRPGNVDKTYLIATGAEDTDIRLLAYEVDTMKDARSDLRCLIVIRKHNTGLQGLQWSADGRYLFSCAGCEEFYIWKISVAPLATLGIVCLGAMPTDAAAGEVPEQRIMGFEAVELYNDGSNTDDFVISLVLSDSSLRVYRVSCTGNSLIWKSVLNGRYTSACLSQCRFLTRDKSENPRYLITAATDGYLAIWDLTDNLSRNEDGKSRPFHVHLVHQSTIKSMALVLLTGKHLSYLIFTGGDDNSLAITRVEISGRTDESNTSTGSTRARTSTLLIPRAHAAAVTAIAILPSKEKDTMQLPVGSDSPRTQVFTVLTTSNDQRVKTWSFAIDRDASGVDGVQVKKACNAYTPVADAGCVDLMVQDAPSMDAAVAGSQSTVRVLICGVGMDVWRADEGV